MERKYAFPQNPPLAHRQVAAQNPRTLCPQQTDWTCALACIRTMLSGFLDTLPSEESLVEEYRLEPGPHYSREIKESGMLRAYQAVYGCDGEVSFDQILDYLDQGYYVMLESMYNYAHWMVLLAYYPLKGGEVEASRLLFYDPYYDQIRSLILDEFLNMWQDGGWQKNGIQKDFIALKG